MIKSIKKLFSLLTREHRSRFYKLQFLIVLMTILEISGVAAMAPFMALVGDINILDGNGYLAQIYQKMGVCPQHDILWGSLTGKMHVAFFIEEVLILLYNLFLELIIKHFLHLVLTLFFLS